MYAPAEIEQLYRQLASIPMETFTKGWWWLQCGGQARQRTVAEMAVHRERYGAGGNCFDLAYWLLDLARAAGIAARPIGHDLESWEAHAALLLTDDAGDEYLCDPGDLWLRPILVSPDSPGSTPASTRASSQRPPSRWSARRIAS